MDRLYLHKIPKGETFQQKFHLKNILKRRCLSHFCASCVIFKINFWIHSWWSIFSIASLFSYAPTKTPSNFNLKFVVGSLRLFIYNIKLEGISRTTFMSFLWQIVISSFIILKHKKIILEILIFFSFCAFFLSVLSVPFRDGRQGNKITNIIAGEKLRETIKHLEGAAGREDS